MQKIGSKLLLDSLDNCWRRYRKLLKASYKNPNEDNIHELRVSTRRLISTIELLQALQPQSTFRRIRKSLKGQLDGFDELRDTQVMLFEAAKSLPILPELEPFLAFMHGREQELLIKSKVHLVEIYQAKLQRKITKASKRFEAQIISTDLSQALSGVVDALYAKVIIHYQALNPTDLASFHQLRIAIKKLRYTLTSVPTKFTEVSIDYLKVLQSNCNYLGNIQNSAVLLKTLATYFRNDIPNNIQQYYRDQQQILVTTFTAHKIDVLDSSSFFKYY